MKDYQKGTQQNRVWISSTKYFTEYAPDFHKKENETKKMEMDKQASKEGNQTEDQEMETLQTNRPARGPRQISSGIERGSQSSQESKSGF